MSMLPLEGLRGIAHESGYSLKFLRGHHRSPSIVKVRWECYAKAYSLGYSLPEIGRFFNRDHTTVLHGIRRYMGMPADAKRKGEKPPSIVPPPRHVDELRVLDAYLTKIALKLWNSAGMGTLQIAKRLGVDEAAVYNSLSNERGKRHAERSVLDTGERRDAS